MRHQRSALVASLAIAIGHVATAHAQQLTGVEMELTALEDSASYLIYRYRIAGAVGSTGGIAEVSLDIASPGAGFIQLPSTGPFTHGPTGATVSPTEHTPIGSMSPAGWKAFLSIDATLDWYGIAGGAVDEDSIPPGAGLSGFGVRSTYLPGIRTVRAEPTWQSCCSQPDPGSEEGEHPSPDSFAVAGTTIGPTRAPSDVTGSAGVALVIDDLDDICVLGWIDDGGVCNSLRVKLVQAQASIIADRPAARQQLQAFLNELDAQRGQHVNENAYWLLRTLAEHVITTI